MWLDKGSVVAAATCAAVMFSTPAGAKPVSIRNLAAQELQLATIAYRISVANAAACRSGDVQTGAVLHDLTRYEIMLRPAISRAFSVSTGFGVLGVVPGSAAAQAGLKVDDEILSIGGVSVEDNTAFRQPRSFRRMERFHAAARVALARGEAEVLVRRSSKLLGLRLRRQPGCGGALTLQNSSVLNAWADGKNVIITTGMTGLSKSDDEIAFVIAHEMAHNILGHSQLTGRSQGIFGRLGAVKRGEIEADRNAVQLMARAGYSPEGAHSFLKNASRRMWWNVSLDHPGFGRRMKIVAAASQGARSTSATDSNGATVNIGIIAQLRRAASGSTVDAIQQNLTGHHSHLGN